MSEATARPQGLRLMPDNDIPGFIWWGANGIFGHRLRGHRRLPISAPACAVRIRRAASDGRAEQRWQSIEPQWEGHQVLADLGPAPPSRLGR